MPSVERTTRRDVLIVHRRARRKSRARGADAKAEYAENRIELDARGAVPDFDAHPRFRQALERVRVAVLEPGEFSPMLGTVVWIRASDAPGFGIKWSDREDRMDAFLRATGGENTSVRAHG